MPKWKRKFVLCLNCWENLTNYGGVTCDGLATPPGAAMNQSAPRLHLGECNLKQV